VEALKIPISASPNRDRVIAASGITVQSRFVRSSQGQRSRTAARFFINSLLEARGYPRSSFEQRAADVSVHYPRVMKTTASRTRSPSASTWPRPPRRAPHRNDPISRHLSE